MKKLLSIIIIVLLLFIVLPQTFAADVADNNDTLTTSENINDIVTIDENSNDTLNTGENNGEVLGVTNNDIVGDVRYTITPIPTSVDYDGGDSTTVEFSFNIYPFRPDLEYCYLYIYVNDANISRLDGHTAYETSVQLNLNQVRDYLNAGPNTVCVRPDKSEIETETGDTAVITYTDLAVNYSPSSNDYETTVTPPSINYEIGTSSDVTVTVNYDSSYANNLKDLDMYVYVNGGSGIVVNGTKANATSFTFDLNNISTVLLKGKENNVSFHPDINALQSLSMTSFNFENLTVYARAPLYAGPIYVNTTGDDNNEGSIDEPVASIEHAIELATDPRNIAHKVIINEGTYTEHI